MFHIVVSDHLDEIPRDIVVGYVFMEHGTADFADFDSAVQWITDHIEQYPVVLLPRVAATFTIIEG